MVVALMTLAAAGFLGCFAATLTLDLTEREKPRARALNRPRASNVSRERA